MRDWKEISPLWGLSDVFTVHEAAALIAGFDPNAVDPSGQYFRNIETNLTDSNGISEVVAVLSILANAIAAPRPRLRAQLRYDAEPRHVAGIDNLVERGFWQREDVFEVKNSDGTAYVVALPDLRKTTIAREDLVAWLRKAGYTAGFFFPEAGQPITDPTEQPDTLSAPAGRWPWGDHHTELLGHLEAAARQHWSKYDPQNQKYTAPKNEEIIKWLKGRKVKGVNVSDAMAKAIATMLRADDLPTGPRK